MKIFHLIDSYDFYGAEKMLISLMEYHQSIGLDSILGSIGAPSIPVKRIETIALAKSLPVVKFRFQNGPNYIGAIKILKFARENNVDIFHCHGYKSNILIGFMPRRFRRIPVISTVHGWTATKSSSKLGLYEWLDAKSLRFVDQVVLVSQQMLQNKRLTHINSSKISIIENGISEDLIENPEYDAEDPIMQFCYNSFVIGSIGRLTPEKGYEYLIRSFNQLKNENINLKLIIIGDGPQKKEFEGLIQRLNLNNKILLPGYQINASKYLSLFDIFVLPSLTEGLPLTLLEAMQAAKPIIATNVGGMPGVLKGTAAGLLINPQNIDELTKTILMLLRDDALRNKMAKNAKAKIKNTYTVKIMGEKYRITYLKMLN